MNILLCVTYKIGQKMADNRLFSPPGVVAMGNALSSRISRPNLWVEKLEILGQNLGGGA